MINNWTNSKKWNKIGTNNKRGVNKMVIEQLIFTVISFAIFVYMFFTMIKNNDTSYVIILVMEAIRNSIKFYRSII